MAPKKNTRAPPPAPTRRSARLASRSPSIEGDTVVSKQVGAKAPLPKTPKAVRRAIWRREEPRREFTPLLTADKRKVLYELSIAQENGSAPPSPPPPPPKPISTALRREWKMKELRRRYDVETPEGSPEVEAAPPSAPSPPGDAGLSPGEQDVVSVAPAKATPSPPSPSSQEDEQPRAGWHMFSSFLGYLTSPFTRKRPAEDPVEPPPSSKRSRVSSHDIVVQSPQEVPAVVGEEPQSQPQSQRTPRPILTPSSPRGFSGPSAKNPKVPTSLSTITEYTEPSLLSNLSNSVIANTPSRPPRMPPQQSNHLQVPQNTPSRRPLGTPAMRRSAQLRAAQVAGLSTPNPNFTARASVPKPRESNADVRLAKLERVRTLRQQLKELEEDEDVKEMQSHRVKRVKIDNLAVIPHNRPGDPSGCFRMPEEDSDDEMEVYDGVEERSNVFDEMNVDGAEVSKQGVQSAGVVGTSTHGPSTQAHHHLPAAPPSTNIALEGVSTQDHQPTATSDTNMVFDFPDVGPIPTDYYVSEAYKAEAGRLFAAGFAEFMKTY